MVSNIIGVIYLCTFKILALGSVFLLVLILIIIIMLVLFQWEEVILTDFLPVSYRVAQNEYKKYFDF